MFNIRAEMSERDLVGREQMSVRLALDIVKRGQTWIDIGAGMGWFVRSLSTAEGIEITAYEPNPRTFSLARSLSYPVENLASKVSWVQKLDQSKLCESFDVATCWEVLEHVDRNTEQEFLRSVATILRNGGYFLLSTPCDSLRSRLLDPCFYFGHRHYSTLKLRKLLKDAGFDIVSLETKGGWTEIVWIWNVYISKWVFRRGPFLLDKFKIALERDYNKQGFNTHIAICRRV